jgi:transposase InsO family protein
MRLLDSAHWLPDTAHTSRPWRIHELTRDFRLEDVWKLPTPGGPDDFPRLVEAIRSGDTSESPSRVARMLFAIRWRIGELLGWDGPGAGVGARVPTLRERLPADLAATDTPSFGTLPFSPLYLTDDEFAAELANRTVHGVMHLGWVPEDAGGFRGQMAVLVKPNGLFGAAYMTAIRPFRHAIVYPALMRQIERGWQEVADEAAPTRDGIDRLGEGLA